MHLRNYLDPPLDSHEIKPILVGVRFDLYCFSDLSS
jgi:hypothetical protein